MCPGAHSGVGMASGAVSAASTLDAATIPNTAVTATDEPKPAQASPCGPAGGSVDAPGAASGASSISQDCCSGSG